MFDKKYLQVSRLIPNDPSRPWPCGYKYQEDTFADVSTPGYFPDNFGVEKGLILVKDTMVCILKDAYCCLEVSSVSPAVVDVIQKFDL